MVPASRPAAPAADAADEEGNDAEDGGAGGAGRDDDGEDELAAAAAGSLKGGQFGEGGEKFIVETAGILSQTAFATLPLSQSTAEARLHNH